MSEETSTPQTLAGIPAWAIITFLGLSGAGSIVSGISSSNSVDAANQASKAVSFLKQEVLENIGTRKYIEQAAERIAILEQKQVAIKAQILESKADSLRGTSEINTKINKVNESFLIMLQSAKNDVDVRLSTLDKRVLELGKIIVNWNFPKSNMTPMPQHFPSSSEIRMYHVARKIIKPN